MTLGREVLKSHGNAGRRRADGSYFNLSDDEAGFAAEVWAAQQVGATYVEQVGKEDGGIDFVMPCCGQTVDVVCNPDMSPRRPHLIKNKPVGRKRESVYADLFLSVSGHTAKDFKMEGWATRQMLLNPPPGTRTNFGYGEKYALHRRHLLPEHPCRKVES